MSPLSTLDNSRILITGGAGLIGRASAASLTRAGAQVSIFDRPHGDVTDSAAVRAALAGMDAVVHLGGYAGLGMADAAETYRVNAVGTFIVLAEAAHAGLTKAVYASSINANGYPLNPAGVMPRTFPYDELLPPSIADEYSLSKQASESAAEMVHARWGLEVTGLRFPLTRDITEDQGHTFGQHIRKAMATDPRRQAAEGWSYLDVSDAARAIELALVQDTPPSPGLLVAAPVTYLSTPTDSALARFAADAERRHIAGRNVALDLSAAKRLLNFQAAVLLDDVAPAELVDALAVEN
jgi:nucleoside-diphosphate-sugar epimerase